MKHHNFVIFIYILIKLGDKVYLLSLKSCVKFHAKFACNAEISTKVVGALFMITLNDEGLLLAFSM